MHLDLHHELRLDAPGCLALTVTPGTTQGVDLQAMQACE